MSDIGGIGKGTSLSPGEMLRLQQETQRRTRAYGELAVALQSGRMFGDNVSRLHAMIGGSLEQLGHAELELALSRMLDIQQRMAKSAIQSMR